jgi:hypothetical protein
MITLIPLLFRNPIEARFWREQQALNHLLELVRSLASLEQVTEILLLVPSNEHFQAASLVMHLDQANACKIHIITLDFSSVLAKELGSASLPGCMDVMAPEVMRELLRLRPGMVGTVLAVDYRNLFLTTDVTEQAIRAHATGKQPALISVRKVLDHPCQFKRYFRVLDLGTVNLHRPGRGVKPGQDGHPSRWALLRPGNNREYILEAGFTGRCKICFPQAQGCACVRAVLQPYASGQAFASLEMELEGGDDPFVSLDLTGKERGILYALLEQVEGGEYDVSGPVPAPNGLWDFDRNGSPVHPNDGRGILGRQDFPPLYELDASLVLVDVGQLPRLNELLNQGQTMGFVLEHGSLALQSERDVILGQAMVQMKVRGSA